MTFTRACSVAAAVLALATGDALAQPLPAMIYGDSLDERATALVEGVDPGYCLAGWSRSFNPLGNSDVLMLKTDPLGLPMWSVISAGLDNDEAYSMVRTHDNCYAVTGWTQSFGIGTPNRNVFVYKTDMAGNLLWGWAYGGLNDDEAYSIIETMDGGYAVAGLTHSFGPAPYPNILVMRLNAAGMVIWSRAYWNLPGHAEDEGQAIVQTPDSGFAVVGRAKTTGPLVYNPFVMKLDQYGNLQWVQTVPGEPADDEGYAVALDLQANILAGGWTRSFGTAPTVTADMFVAQFAAGGGPPIWSWSYGWPAGDEQAIDDRAVVATTDCGSAVCGPTTSVGPGIPNPNFMILKLDPGGMPMWCRSHPSPYDPGLLFDVPRPIIELAAGGYAVAGWTNSFPYLGSEDFHLLTLDVAGNRPVCVEPQEPGIESLPWIDWMFEDTLCFPEIDSMLLEPAPVLFHPICEETTSVRERRRAALPGRSGIGLAVRGGALELSLSRDEVVRVAAYSAAGRLRRVVADRRFAAGRHVLGRPRFGPGIYLVQAESGTGRAVAKLVVH